MDLRRILILWLIGALLPLAIYLIIDAPPMPPARVIVPIEPPLKTLTVKVVPNPKA